MERIGGARDGIGEQRMNEEKERKSKDYGVGRSIRMLFRGFVEMLRISMWLAPVLCGLIALYGIYALVNDFDAVMKVLRLFGLKF